MADKPRFSPTDTYVLDDTVIHEINTVKMTGIMRQLDEYASHLNSSDADLQDIGEMSGLDLHEPRYDPQGKPLKR